MSREYMTQDAGVLLLPRQKSQDLHDTLTYLGRVCHITSKCCHSSLQSHLDYPTL